MDDKLLRGGIILCSTELIGFLLKANQGDNLWRVGDEEFDQISRVIGII